MWEIGRKRLGVRLKVARLSESTNHRLGESGHKVIAPQNSSLTKHEVEARPMKAGIPFLALIALIAADARGEESPHLVIDAGGHTAAVNKVCFLDDERLASVSNDKTLRIWSISAGETIAVLRPPIGPGSAGMLYAIDVSPDGRWLAAGGFEYAGEDHGVYLIDLVDQTISGILRGHTNVIIDVAFSPDGRWLASSSADKTARLWDVTSRRLVATARGLSLIHI